MANADKIAALQEALEQADCIIIGAGAGLSTSAGFTYSGGSPLSQRQGSGKRLGDGKRLSGSP